MTGTSSVTHVFKFSDFEVENWPLFVYINLWKTVFKYLAWLKILK